MPPLWGFHVSLRRLDLGHPSFSVLSFQFLGVLPLAALLFFAELFYVVGYFAGGYWFFALDQLADFFYYVGIG